MSLSYEYMAGENVGLLLADIDLERVSENHSQTIK